MIKHAESLLTYGISIFMQYLSGHVFAKPYKICILINILCIFKVILSDQTKSLHESIN